MYKIIDFKTKQLVSPSNLVFTGGETCPWEVMMNFDEVRQKINTEQFRATPIQSAKYLPFLPIKNHSKFISLNEGHTPLIQSKHIGTALGIDLWFKLEHQNPTGSFKDRGSAVDLTVALELGAKAIVLASTGNMAASCACYAAAAGLPCFVFVPEGTPRTKLAQVIAFGGHIVQVKGEYNDCARIAEKVAHEMGFYLAGDYAFRVEGQKTAAFEICDQFNYQAPDVVLVPIGCGTNITGYGKGFREYHQLGFIDKLPRLVGIQATGAASVYNAFCNKSADVEKLPGLNTIASAISVTYPLDGAKALAEIYQSNGSSIAVSDREMLEAQYELSGQEGHFVEVSCASTLSALRRMAQNENLSGKKVVCVLTGNGLKDPSPILKVAVKPPTIYADVKEFLKLYNNQFFQSKTVSFREPGEIVFSTAPSIQQVEDYLKRNFDAHYSQIHLACMQKSISSMLLKGKSVTFSDLQDIIQDALRHSESSAPDVLVLENFEIVVQKDKQPKASVVVRFAGNIREATALGVGPVDAVINALKEATKEHSLSFDLTDYQVSIRSRGPGAVTEVELRLKSGVLDSVATGVSPDIIQASIEAFIKAYNNLYELIQP